MTIEDRVSLEAKTEYTITVKGALLAYLMKLLLDKRGDLEVKQETLPKILSILGGDNRELSEITQNLEIEIETVDAAGALLTAIIQANGMNATLAFVAGFKSEQEFEDDHKAHSERAKAAADLSRFNKPFH